MILVGVQNYTYVNIIQQCSSVYSKEKPMYNFKDNELESFLFPANTAQYAHYVFNTLDQDRSGLLSFEVR